MGIKKKTGGLIGIAVAIALVGLLVANWSGAQLEWWQKTLWIVGMLAFAVLAFSLWISEDHSK